METQTKAEVPEFIRRLLEDCGEAMEKGWKMEGASHSHYLFNLIAKSDHVNRERLREGFALHVAVYEQWYFGEKVKPVPEHLHNWPIDRDGGALASLLVARAGGAKEAFMRNLRVLCYADEEEGFVCTCPYCMSLVAFAYDENGDSRGEQSRCTGCGRTLRVRSWTETQYRMEVVDQDV